LNSSIGKSFKYWAYSQIVFPEPSSIPTSVTTLKSQSTITRLDRKGAIATANRKDQCFSTFAFQIVQHSNRSGAFNMQIVQHLYLVLKRAHIRLQGQPILNSDEAKATATIQCSDYNYSMLSYVGYSTASTTLMATAMQKLSFCIRYRTKCATTNDDKLKSAQKAKRHMRQGETSAIHGIQVLDGQFIIFLSACLAFLNLASIISSTANSINCDISSLGYDKMLSLSWALVCEGVHDKLKTSNGVFRP